jgi:O-acetyl-ADP-ribose deacetylase (regulator of RNase III)
VTPSFAWIFDGLDYLALLHLNPGSAGVVERVMESARSSPDLEAEIRELLSEGWRPALVACAALQGRSSPALLDLLWGALDRGSWVAPQMAITLWMLDDRFPERSRQRLLQGISVTPEPERATLSGPEVHVIHGPAGTDSLSAKTRVSLMTVLAHDQDGRDWLLNHVAKADALQDVLVEDAWDNSARLVASWSRAVAECLEVSGLAVDREVLLKLWPPTAPEWLLSGELETGFLEPLLTAGVSQLEWIPDQKGDLVVAEPVGRIRFERPYDALLRQKLGYRMSGDRLFTSLGNLRVSPGERMTMTLLSERALPIELSRERLEDSGARTLVYGASQNGRMTAGPAAALLGLAGPELEWELMCDLSMGDRCLGRVVQTGSYGLSERGVRRVYHIVALESPRGCSQPEKLGEALYEVLQAGYEGVVAVASMASGGGGVKPERIARILVGAARRFFAERPRSPVRVLFCLPLERDYEAFERALQN